VPTRGLRLGLTGGIGSGKSTAAAILREAGATIIDADAIVKDITATNGTAIEPIEISFGSSMLTADRALDRVKMRQLIFTDSTAKSTLETILHPIVGRTMAQQADLAEQAGARCIVFDIPLLVESAHWRSSLDRILVVDCTQSIQIDRVTRRSGLNEAEVREIVRTQATRTQRLAAADWVVFNDNITTDTLAQQVQEIARQFGL